MQIGLTAVDTADPTAMYFPMNPDSNVSAPTNVFPGTDCVYRSQQLFNADLSITGHDKQPLFSPNVGLTPDTGASTTLHNTQHSGATLPGQFSEFTDWSQQDLLGVLKSGLQFGLSGTTLANQRSAFLGSKPVPSSIKARYWCRTIDPTIKPTISTPVSRCSTSTI
jgi:hypothetical protein